MFVQAYKCRDANTYYVKIYIDAIFFFFEPTLTMMDTQKRSRHRLSGKLKKKKKQKKIRISAKNGARLLSTSGQR